MNKIISFFVLLVMWLLLIILQTYTVSYQGAVPNAFEAPELYYSTWLVDLYLIILFYLNYYLFAPMMIRRKLFHSYIYIIVTAMIVGFLIPIICFYTQHWSMPGVVTGQMPISLTGIVGALGVIAVGLALRSIKEWTKLEPQKKELKASVAKIKELHGRIQELNTQVQEHQVETRTLEERIQRLEKDIDAYRNIYGALSESEFNK